MRVSKTLLVIFAAIAWCAASAAGVPVAWAEAVRVDAHPVALNADDASQTIAGQLDYRGGLALSSPDPRFGGFSALGVSADGRRMVALTDRGARFSAHLVYDERGHLAGLRNTDMGAMSGLDGAPLRGSFSTDAEAMSAGVEGEIIVAFERRHRLRRYLPGRATPEALAAPAELDGAPSNGGIEALTLLDDGRLLALTEAFGSSQALVGWVSDAAGWSVLTYGTLAGFHPTGAATLGNGDVVVLERAFSRLGTNAARLVRLDGAAIVPGARLSGSEIATLQAPLIIDNFEGIAARQGDSGEDVLYIISDDNFRARQRTLLLMFALGRQ
jgi:hypothetical protein